MLHLHPSLTASAHPPPPAPPTPRDPIHRTVPIAKNIAVAAASGTNLELRLRGYDLDGDALTYKVTSLPSHGSLIQLSHNYDYYGYDPKEGNALATAGTTVTGSNARVIFSPPADGKGALSLGKWGEFLYEVTDGAAQSKVGKVTLLRPDLVFVGSDFGDEAKGVDGWTVSNNNGVIAPTHDKSTYGSSLSWYVHATDNDINTAAGGEDQNMWYFDAPAAFLGAQSTAYGGSVEFNLAGFSGFEGGAGAGAGGAVTANPGRHLVLLTCATCARGLGITLGMPILDTQFVKTSDFDAKVVFALTETSGWVKDSKSTLVKWTPPTQCEMVEVLSNLSALKILGDFTTYYESVGLDNVVIKRHASSDAPVPHACYLDAGLVLA